MKVTSLSSSWQVQIENEEEVLIDPFNEAHLLLEEKGIGQEVLEVSAVPVVDNLSKMTSATIATR